MNKRLWPILLLLINLTANAYEFKIPNRAADDLKKLSDCYDLLEGCSVEQELAIAEIKGTVLNSSDVDQLLMNDPERSYFIPLSLDNSELLTLAAATSLGIVAFHNDQEITDTIVKHKTKLTDTVTTVGNFLGGSAFIPLSAGSYLLGVYYDNNKLKRVGLITLGASVVSGLVVSGVKEVFGRVRPNENLGPYQFFKNGQRSFYSGHTSQAFTLATIISELYKSEYPVIPYIAYGMASITAYARVKGLDHWASDVIVGAVAGHLVTKLFLSAINDNEENRGGLQIYPDYDYLTGTIMVHFEYREQIKKNAMKCANIENLEKRIHACFEERFGQN